MKGSRAKSSSVYDLTMLFFALAFLLTTPLPFLLIPSLPSVSTDTSPRSYLGSSLRSVDCTRIWIGAMGAIVVAGALVAGAVGIVRLLVTGGRLGETLELKLEFAVCELIR